MSDDGVWSEMCGERSVVLRCSACWRCCEAVDSARHAMTARLSRALSLSKGATTVQPKVQKERPQSSHSLTQSNSQHCHQSQLH